ncbi:MAG: hypothetical protein OXN17_07595 [Candidatus Poribacteria bacterium]|nr:hypothetical protein [Candidatus Poribacteria bacterium]MDE0504223.1 hypothetical protein [Candidatus Poribacteria bacterium]
MSSLANAVRTRVSEECLTTRCQKEGCKVSLPRIGGFPDRQRPYVVIDMDHSESPASQDEQRCDFLFVGECENQGWVVPLELKRGQPTANEIVHQLRAGASIAEDIVPRNAEAKFRPVAAYGGELKRHQLKLFRYKANRIEFRGQREGVRLIRCGVSLKHALKSP